MEPVVLDVESVAPEAGPVREEDAFRAGRRDVDERADHERAVLDVDGLPFRDGGSVRVVDVGVAWRGELRPRRRVDLDGRAVVEREAVVRAGLGEPEVDQLPDLVRLLLGEVVLLGPVGVRVVQLPGVVVVGAPARDRRVGGDGLPALVTRSSGSRASSRTASCGLDSAEPSSNVSAHAHSVELALRVPLDCRRRLDSEHVEDRRDDVDRVEVLVANLAAGLGSGGPGDDARVARAAVELVPLPHLERRVERHRPAGRVVVVGPRASELVDHREVLRQIVGDPVDHLHLVDRAIRAAFAARPVVGDDDDHRVVQLAHLLEVVEQAPDVEVGVGDEARIDLGHAREQALLVVVEGVPGPNRVEHRERLPVRAGAGLGRPDRVQRRELGVLGDDPELDLIGERCLADRLVAHVELALELVDPLLRRVVRRMAGTGGEVEEERLVRCDRLGVTDELERLVGEILGEVVALVRRLRLVDHVVVVDQVGIPLVRLGAEEPVPALEAAAGRPVAARGGEVHLVGRAEMPLADHVSVPAELAEDLREHPVLRRDRAAGAREAHGRLGDAGHAVARVVAAGEEAGTGGGAERRRVELRVADALVDDAVEIGCRDWPAVAAQRREADVIQDDVEDVRRALRRAWRLEWGPVGLRVANVDVDRSLEGLRHLWLLVPR